MTLAMALALLLDALIGWPKQVYERLGHPVTWIGGVISWLDTRLNYGGSLRRRVFGGLSVLIVLAAAVLPAWAIERALPAGMVGVILAGFLAWPLVAARSLFDHVKDPLATGDLARARAAVSHIVGRDPNRLDAAGVARAAIESLAENASDGVVAPLFWGALLGLPGIFAYKAINTLDSMIGHKSERYRDFGLVAARLDDLVNLIPARATALAFALAAGRRMGPALRLALKEARQHRSPNAGWPEAAMAGALSIRLSGPRVYYNRVADEPWINGLAPDPTARDIDRALALYRRAMALVWAVLVALGLALQVR